MSLRLFLLVWAQKLGARGLGCQGVLLLLLLERVSYSMALNTFWFIAVHLRVLIRFAHINSKRKEQGDCNRLSCFNHVKTAAELMINNFIGQASVRLITLGSIAVIY